MSDPMKSVFANFDLRGIILASNTKRIVEEMHASFRPIGIDEQELVLGRYLARMLSARKARFASVVRDVRVYGEAYDAYKARVWW